MLSSRWRWWFLAVVVTLAVGTLRMVLKDRAPVTAEDSSPAFAAPSAGRGDEGPLGSGVVGQWDFDGTLDDASGEGNAARGMGQFNFTSAGKLGTALELDGVAAYAEVPDRASLRPPALTVALWFNASRSPRGTLISKPQLGAPWRFPFLSWMIRVNEPTVVEASLGSASTYSFHDGVFSVPRIEPGQWHHVALTYDGKVATFYFDGAALGSRPFAGPIAYSDQPVLIGADHGELPIGDLWPGRIDQVVIWNRALSAAEILALTGRGPGTRLR